MWILIAQFVFGVLLLVAGAEWLVRGAANLARACGVSALLIGLTVVAFGTSAPELAVSINAARQGTAGIAVGNVLGSNIANLLLVLGLSALLMPLAVNRQVLRQEMPVLIVATVLSVIFLLDGSMTRLEGGALFVLAVLYTVFQVWQVRRAGAPAQEGDDTHGDDEAAPAEESRGRGVLADCGLIVAGLVGLVWGADWLVQAAVEVARQLGVSEFIIGLTIVAVGTSLPEIATSLVAVRKGEGDLAVGNVVGSNLFNLLVVLGLTAVFARGAMPVPDAALEFDLWFMLVSTLVCLPLMAAQQRVGRAQGALLLVWYAVYVLWLVLVTRFGSIPSVAAQVILYGLLPVSLVWVLGGWVRGRCCARR
ncbi:MAG: calcium/sodium antiporter [Rhodocyclaceae bacterium]|nr:calcium/sodium antiporter [Rhodocyclaceae bacterium]